MSTFDKAAAMARKRTTEVNTAHGALPLRTPTMAEFRRYISSLTKAKGPTEEARNDLEFIRDVAVTPEGAHMFDTPEEVDAALTPEEILDAGKAVRDLMHGAAADPTATP